MTRLELPLSSIPSSLYNHPIHPPPPSTQSHLHFHKILLHSYFTNSLHTLTSQKQSPSPNHSRNSQIKPHSQNPNIELRRHQPTRRTLTPTRPSPRTRRPSRRSSLSRISSNGPSPRSPGLIQQGLTSITLTTRLRLRITIKITSSTSTTLRQIILIIGPAQFLIGSADGVGTLDVVDY